MWSWQTLYLQSLEFSEQEKYLKTTKFNSNCYDSYDVVHKGLTVGGQRKGVQVETTNTSSN